MSEVENVRPLPKKALNFWSHSGNYQAIRKEFPEATCTGSNFKYGLPLVDLWTVHSEPEREEDYRARFSPFVYDFKKEEPEILVGLREILGEILEIEDWAEVLVKAKAVLSSLIEKEEKRTERNLKR